MSLATAERIPARPVVALKIVGLQAQARPIPEAQAKTTEPEAEPMVAEAKEAEPTVAEAKEAEATVAEGQREVEVNQAVAPIRHRSTILTCSGSVPAPLST